MFPSVIGRRLTAKLKMFIGEPKTFHDSAKPLVYFNCMIGMGAYRQPDVTDTAYLCMQLYVIIFSLTYWIMAYIGLNWITNLEYHKASLSSVYTMFVLVYSNACIAAVSPLLIWLQTKRLWDCAQQITILDNTIQDILGGPNEHRKQYVRLICQIIGIVLLVSFVGIADTPWILSTNGSRWYQFVFRMTAHYPIIVMLVLDLNFCTWVGCLRKQFRDLNDGLLALAEKPSARYPGKKIFVTSLRVPKATPGSGAENTQAESVINENLDLLHRIRKVHLELCKLSGKINLAFGVQNLLSIGISFVIVTGLLYNMYDTLKQNYFTISTLVDLGSVIIWTAIYTFKIWIVNHFSGSVSNEAERTGEVVYELLETRVDRELQKEIQEFAIQMVQNPVRFNACGFFTLDYTTVQCVIGSITTYLVILIQMNQGSENPAAAPNASDAALNRTEIP